MIISYLAEANFDVFRIKLSEALADTDHFTTRVNTHYVPPGWWYAIIMTQPSAKRGRRKSEMADSSEQSSLAADSFFYKDNEKQNA